MKEIEIWLPTVELILVDGIRKFAVSKSSIEGVAVGSELVLLYSSFTSSYRFNILVLELVDFRESSSIIEFKVIDISVRDEGSILFGTEKKDEIKSVGK